MLLGVLCFRSIPKFLSLRLIGGGFFVWYDRKMGLDIYKKKRQFHITSEPEGVETKKSLSRFVVNEHHASRLHFDFRLELPDEFTHGPIVLKSWAVPKGIPLEKGIKHLAVETEDHPVAYLTFEGVIPQGEYGAGKSIIWDTGTFSDIEFEKKDTEVTVIRCILKGKKLKGAYVLVKTHFLGKKNSWLLFKQ